MPRPVFGKRHHQSNKPASSRWSLAFLPSARRPLELFTLEIHLTGLVEPPDAGHTGQLRYVRQVDFLSAFSRFTRPIFK